MIDFIENPAKRNYVDCQILSAIFMRQCKIIRHSMTIPVRMRRNGGAESPE